MELIWPYNRHIMINSGIVEYSTEHTDWQLEQCEYPEVFMARNTKFVTANRERLSSSTCYNTLNLYFTGFLILISWYSSDRSQRQILKLFIFSYWIFTKLERIPKCFRPFMTFIISFFNPLSGCLKVC